MPQPNKAPAERVVHAKSRKLNTAALTLAVAAAAAVLAPQSARAACTPTTTPATGQTVTCTSSQPNPVTTPIIAQPGATGVTVIMQSGAQLNVSGNTAITFGGGGNITNNSGAIIQGAMGIVDTGPVTIANSSTITGTSGPAIVLNGPGDSTINNMGTIGGSGTLVVQFNSVAGSTQTLNNTGNGSINGNVTGSGDGGITIVDAGNFNGGITINGNGINSLTTAPGHNINSLVSITGAQNTVINGGAENSGMVLSATVSNTVTNQANAFINQVFTLSGPSNTVDNFGTLNAGITVSGDGTNTITNEAGASLNSKFTVTGSAANSITNAGTINATMNISGSGSVFDSGTISGGATAINFTASPGPFTLTLTPTFVINGTVNGTGADDFQLAGTGNGNFNVNNIGAAQQYRGFATFDKLDLSTWTLTGTGAQNWSIQSGTLIGDTNSLGGDTITNNSALVFNQSFTGAHAGVITGSGGTTIQGGGTVVFTGNNTYTGDTTINGATLQLGNGGSSGSIAGNVVDNGSLVFNRADTLDYGGTITGNGTIVQAGSGTTRIASISDAFGGATSVNAGTLRVQGTLGNASSTVSVNNGGTLAGVGTIGGVVTVNSGGTLAGTQATTLTTGPLALNSGSNINVSLGSPETTVPAFNVNGSLTLAGTLNITDLGGFESGVYRLFNYSGALTDNGVVFGTLPSGVTASDLTLQTSVANVINLDVNIPPPPTPIFRFWDGASGHNNGVIDGGSGVWNAVNSNWTTSDGSLNGAWTTNFAFFQGTPGTVTVDNSAGAISATGMHFAVSGYHLTGDILTLEGTSPRIRVGDGTAAGASYVATIDNVLAGAGTLTKTDLGTLILTGANTYQGGTDILAGTISIFSDANLGAGSGALSFVSGALQTTANAATSRSIDIGNSASFVTSANTSFVLMGNVGGPGSLSEDGAGTLILSSDKTFLGGISINSGTVQFGAGGAAGSVVGDVVDNGVLAIDRADTFTFDGAISGSGSVNQLGSGTTVLTAISTYTGMTTVASGNLTVTGALAGTSAISVGDGGAATLLVESGGEIDSGSGVLGNLAGTTGTAIVTDPNSVWKNSGSLIIGNAGTGTLIITNQGSVITGPVSIAAQPGSTGTLIIGAPVGQPGDPSPGTLSPPSITFGAGTGTIIVNQANPAYIVETTISGTGTIELIGPGTTILTPNSNTFTGTVAVNAGTLAVNGTLGSAMSTRSATSTVTVNSGGVLTGMGTVGGAVTVAGGGTLAGTQGQVLTMGPLTLSSGSNINVALGAPASTGLFNVNGPLTLAGTLNITDLGGFGPGTYRLFNYTGALTDNGVVFGTLPPGTAPANLSVQTSVAQQVNLIDSGGGAQLQFWDGPNTTANSTVDGGTGTWNVTDTNWTSASGTVNGSWNTDFATFEAKPGTVTVDNSAGAIAETGMQFAVSGYTLNGGKLMLAGSMPIIRVGDGTAAGAGYIATIDNVLAGPGELVKTDLGTLVLGGANTYSGGTLIQAGRLTISSDINLGAPTGALTFQNGTLETTASIVTNRGVIALQSATLQTDAATTLELDGAITGTGIVTKTGAGTLIIVGAPSQTGGTVIGAGTLQLGNGGASGSLSGNVVNNGSFVVNRSDVYTFAGNISGAGSFTQAGSGTTILTGNSDNAGGTTIAGGTLQVGNGGTSGTIVGNILDNSVLAVDRSDSFTFTGIVSGTGSVVQLGTGTITATGNNTFTGGLTIANGTIVIGDGNTSGSFISNVVDNATLAFNREDVLTYSGVISGNGALQQTGAGTTILTGDSNAFAGSTAVNAGTLAVNGKLGSAASTLAVNNGGTLAGTGTVGGSTTINAGGTLSPAGNALGVLTINGNLTFVPGSIYRVDLTPAAADLVVVGGQAKPAGEVQVFIGPGNYLPNAVYPIVSATGGVSGTFNTLDPPSSSIFFQPTLSYDANHVYLVITDATFVSVAQTPNQLAVAQAVATLPVTSPVFAAAFNVNSEEEARQAFDALSGEAYPSTAGAMLQESRYVREAVLARLRGAYDVQRSDSVDPPASGMWVQGLGAFASADSDGNAAALQRNVAGAIAGYDTALDVFRIGAAGAYLHSDLDVDQRFSRAAFDSFDLAIYGEGQLEQFILRAGAAYAWQNVTMRRFVNFSGFGDLDGAHYRAPSLQGFGEVAYDLPWAPFLLEPFGNAAYVSVDTHGFAESGGGAALTAQDQSLHTIFTAAGVHASYGLGRIDGTPMSAVGTLGWQHAFSDLAPTETLAFVDGGIPFTIAGAPLARNSAVLEAGFNFAITEAANVALAYSGQIADSARDNEVRLTFDWNF